MDFGHLNPILSTTLTQAVFHWLVLAHIVSGASGLVMFWVPVMSRKGSGAHRKWGRRFAISMLITGTIAIGIALASLIEPLGTHKDFTDPALVRGLFGWMMLYLALLTVSLAWHSLQVLSHSRDHTHLRTPFTVGLQIVMMVSALVCAYEGFVLGQVLMVGIAVIGLVSGTTNLWYIFSSHPRPYFPLMEHVKSGVGAGISAYTAFLSVGLVRLMPEEAFNPAIWSIPSVIGISLILWHHRRIAAAGGSRLARTVNAPGPSADSSAGQEVAR